MLSLLFRWILGIVVFLIAVVSLVVIVLAGVFISLPDVSEISHCMTTELYHVHLCEKDPHFVPFSEISPNIIGAVIMSEDASFYSHPGIDLYEMKESMKKDLNEWRFARGASTITQQLAKNAFLSKSKNVLRKVEEIYLAFQLEKHFHKTQILEYYLNVVEFGQDMYGVKDACRKYFDKAPSEVTPEEGAFLAFLLPNPKKYSQSFTRKKLTPFAERTIKTILHKMMLGHKITEEEYAMALNRVPDFPWNGIIPATNVEDVDNAKDLPPDDGTDNVDTDDDFKFDFTPEEK